MNDGPVAGERRGFDDLVVPVDVERLGLLVDEDLEEREEIAPIEARLRGGETTRHVVVADDLEAVDVGDAGAHHEHLGRRYRAGGRYHHR